MLVVKLYPPQAYPPTYQPAPDPDFRAFYFGETVNLTPDGRGRLQTAANTFEGRFCGGKLVAGCRESPLGQESPQSRLCNNGILEKQTKFGVLQVDLDARQLFEGFKQNKCRIRTPKFSFEGRLNDSGQLDQICCIEYSPNQLNKLQNEAGNAGSEDVKLIGEFVDGKPNGLCQIFYREFCYNFEFLKGEMQKYKLMSRTYQVLGFPGKLFYVDADGCKLAIDGQWLFKFSQGLVFKYEVEQKKVSLANILKLLENKVNIVQINGAAVGVDENGKIVIVGK